MAESRQHSTDDLAAAATDRRRAVHSAMIDAVLGERGLEEVAKLAAAAAGAPVAIVLPRFGVASCSSPTARASLSDLKRYVAGRLESGSIAAPEGVTAEAPIIAGGEALGAVVLLADASAHPADDAVEYLHLAALASLTEVALEQAKAEVEHTLRGSFLEEVRSHANLDPTETVRRASRLGCDLSRGAVVMCVDLSGDRPRQVIATIVSEHPGALAENLDARVYALLPALAGGDPARATTDSARRLAHRLERHGTVGHSSFYGEAAELPRAVQEAELVLNVLTKSDGRIAEEIGTGTYRLLFRVLASHPEEVRAYYDDTVAPIVEYDRQYATDLVGTLEAYLEQNCNMNATAATIYAHRHTIAYRLERVRDLTGLDAAQSEQRERLSLGLKAYRIIAPHLPR